MTIPPSQPDPSLFQVPSDYKMVDEKVGPFILHKRILALRRQIGVLQLCFSPSLRLPGLRASGRKRLNNPSPLLVSWLPDSSSTTAALETALLDWSSPLTSLPSNVRRDWADGWMHRQTAAIRIVADGNFIRDLVHAAAPQDSDLATD
jgi:hypothetical protein